jgi:hypothetical protein
MPRHDKYLVGGLAVMLEPAAEALWQGRSWSEFFDGIGGPELLIALAGFLLVWRGVIASGALRGRE